MSDRAARFVSRLTHKTLALILAGGRGSRLKALTDWRTKPAVPFGGKFRIIDFALSNCINSDIRKICVLTQYKSHSLIQHLLKGWSNFNSERGEFLDIVPAQQWLDEGQWYRGTADAVRQSMDIVDSYGPEYVLILAGDHIYNMDYGELLAAHVESGADFTIACNTIHKSEASHFGVMKVDAQGRIIDFKEKPEQPDTIPGNRHMSLVSMGIYVFSTGYMREQLEIDAADLKSSHDFGKDIIPKALDKGHKIQSYEFNNPVQNMEPYWRDVGTIDAYYMANMEIIAPDPPLDVYDPDWQIVTYQPQLPPAHFAGCGNTCHVENAMVSGGCVIQESRLVNSILFSNVKVYSGCDLQGVLALPGCEIGTGAKLKNVILDNKCKVPPYTVIGYDRKEDAKKFDISPGGVILVTRKTLGQGGNYLPGVAVEDRQ
ncbi:MAG: glucose-1-phosphate adenylyltransferase [Hyphomicrobiales bacterium]|nr:MAG: glucose-1-phosphate adenylyltransferase [Hyphomicrobiales bacterium]